MQLSMYQASIPLFVRMLENMSAILGKAAAHAEAKKIDPSIFVNARLAPDMYPLSRQIQIATDMAKGCGARLAGIDVPSYEDNETSFGQLQARIAKTTALKEYRKRNDSGAVYDAPRVAVGAGRVDGVGARAEA